jgi:hypothetical protein
MSPALSEYWKARQGCLKNLGGETSGPRVVGRSLAKLTRLPGLRDANGWPLLVLTRSDECYDDFSPTDNCPDCSPSALKPSFPSGRGQLPLTLQVKFAASLTLPLPL